MTRRRGCRNRCRSGCRSRCRSRCRNRCRSGSWSRSRSWRRRRRRRRRQFGLRDADGLVRHARAARPRAAAVRVDRQADRARAVAGRAGGQMHPRIADRGGPRAARERLDVERHCPAACGNSRVQRRDSEFAWCRLLRHGDLGAVHIEGRAARGWLCVRVDAIVNRPAALTALRRRDRDPRRAARRRPRAVTRRRDRQRTGCARRGRRRHRALDADLAFGCGGRGNRNGSRAAGGMDERGENPREPRNLQSSTHRRRSACASRLPDIMTSS